VEVDMNVVVDVNLAVGLDGDVDCSNGRMSGWGCKWGCGRECGCG
jgi:hypothetical protein